MSVCDKDGGQFDFHIGKRVASHLFCFDMRYIKYQK